MKLLFTLALLAGAGFWMARELQHEQELQTQLDETKKSLDDAQKQLQAYQVQQQQQQYRPQQRIGTGQWSNPLDAPARRVGK
jgi:hypothetical protein